MINAYSGDSAQGVLGGSSLYDPLAVLPQSWGQEAEQIEEDIEAGWAFKNSQTTQTP